MIYSKTLIKMKSLKNIWEPSGILYNSVIYSRQLEAYIKSSSLRVRERQGKRQKGGRNRPWQRLFCNTQHEVSHPTALSIVLSKSAGPSQKFSSWWLSALFPRSQPAWGHRLPSSALTSFLPFPSPHFPFSPSFKLRLGDNLWNAKCAMYLQAQQHLICSVFLPLIYQNTNSKPAMLI